MEKEGTIKLFQRSLSNGLRFKFIVCDGDTSAYEAVKDYFIKQEQQQPTYSETLGDEDDGLLVKKEDCMNHAGKRVLKYLIKLKREKTRKVPPHCQRNNQELSSNC